MKSYDETLAATPAAAGVAHATEIIGDVAGEWCRVMNASKGAVILYLHGGGYVMGTAKAYRNFVGQFTARNGLMLSLLITRVGARTSFFRWRLMTQRPSMRLLPIEDSTR